MIMRKFSTIFLVLFGVPLFCFLVSNTATTLGDKAFVADRLNQAHFLYSLASFTNPFNKAVSMRLLAVNVNLKERLHESEETSSPRSIAQVIAPSNVLGITSCVPVLMYHYIRINPWPTDKVGFGLSTPPNTFAEELDYFKSKGYETITLADLRSQIEFHKALDIRKKNPNYKLPHVKLLPAKPLIITLDDGYKDAFTEAYPLLKARNMKAVEFVITGFVGLPNYLEWSDIVDMDRSGVFEIESHTVHHYALGGTYWNDNVVKYEMTQSKKDLESHLGKPVDWFAYPYGSVNDHASEEAAKIYFAAFGTNFGSYQSTEEQFTLPRIRVSGGDWGPSVDNRIQQALADAKCVH